MRRTPQRREQLWEFDSSAPARGNNRGVAHRRSGSEERIFAGVREYVYSLDAKTGKRDPQFGIGVRIDFRADLRGGSVGPFSHSIRPFTVNAAQTMCYVNVNELLGFEIGNIKSGKKLHRQPGWVTFSIDGRHAYPSTGEVFDTRTKKLVTALNDETGRQVGSEKLLEVVFESGKPVRAGDQFGMGGKTVSIRSSRF